MDAHSGPRVIAGPVYDSPDGSLPSPWILIEGITNLPDARLAEAAGADAIGLTLVTDDPREVRPDDAASILATVTIPTVVSVDTNDEDFLREVCLLLDPTHLQFTPSSPLPRVQPSCPWFRSYRLDGRRTLSVLRDHTGDRFVVLATAEFLPGGRRYQRDPGLLREIGRLGRLVLGGALDEENVVEVVRRARPWGLSVDAGVERETGVKDWSRLQRFIHRAREAR